MPDLADEYRARCRTHSDIVDHLSRLVDVVVDLHAQHVIELGVNTGNSTIAFLYGLTATGGWLTSIDCSAPPEIVAPHWRFIHGDDLAESTVEQCQPCDVLFVDTTHEYDQTMRELALYGPLVIPGGRILLHDTALVIAGEQPVLRAMREYADTLGFAWSNDPTGSGMGEIVVA